MIRRPMVLRGIAVVVALLIGLTAPIPVAALQMVNQPSQPSTQLLRFGSFDLRACPLVVEADYRSWCGRILRPVDNGMGLGQQVRQLPVRFAVVLPKRINPSAIAELQRVGTLVGLEGGPGYGATSNAWSYASMFDRLLKSRALILMDARGTGRSAAIDCPSLMEDLTDYSTAVSACGKSLGDDVVDFGTSAAMTDLAAIVRGLGFTQADVYGGSYGTFAAQVFAHQHPELVRSLVLDGAYPVTGETAWYPTQGPALNRALMQVCQQDSICQEQPSDTVAVLRQVLDRVRLNPVTIKAPGDDGKRHAVTIDPSTLVEVAFGGTYGTTMYREFDPALRAFLAGDALPLGRLVAEQQFPGGPEETILDYSAGQFIAVSCQDYPQLFDLSADQRERARQRDAAVHLAEQEAPEIYAPFTIGEYLGSSWQSQDLCLGWPRLAAGTFGPPVDGPYPDVPTLVLSGSLDTITTAAEGDMVAAQFPRSRHVVIPNGVHVQALGGYQTCTSNLVQDFVQAPATVLQEPQRGCDDVVPRLTPTFLAGTLTTPVATGVTLADIVNRWRMSGRYSGLGLRSGTWQTRTEGKLNERITFSGVRVFPGLPVSGSMLWRPGGDVTANVTVPDGTLRLTWNTRKTGAVMHVSGVLNGQQVRTRFPAP
jgi:pimeloyl-ACP methyl ester carboxylesterase